VTGAPASPGTPIVLIRPWDRSAVPPDAPVQDPLGVGFLAAALRKRRHEVAILDAHALGLDDSGLVACTAALSPSIVGLSLHSFADYAHCVSISRSLAELPRRPRCVWGGEHATFHAERILRQHPEVDAIVLGEGEEVLCDLVEQVLAKPGQPISEPIRGAAIRGPGGAFRHCGFREAIADLDSLPLAHKDVVEQALRNGRRVSLSILTGRGCTHRCTFCTAHSFMRLAGGRVWRRRSPSCVVDELEALSRRYRSNPLVHPVIQFQDVIFLGTSRVSRRWIRDFVDEMERRKLSIPFYCMARADALLANEDVLPRLVAVGLRSVEMGIESGIDRILALCNKLNSAQDNERAVTMMRRLGIAFDASGFIMFDPRMTLAELRENALYLARFGAATWDFFVTRVQLYPGTVIREEMIAKGAYDGADDIGRTAGYRFEDERVAAVAEHARYYDLTIRALDLLLREAKAAIANDTRSRRASPRPLVDAVDLVHDTYCRHFLELTDCAERGTLATEAQGLKRTFLARVATLTELMRAVLAACSEASAAAA
jgi:hypothetical protein